MTAEFLQRDFIAELHRLLDDLPLLTSGALEPVEASHFKIFPQDIPLQKAAGDWEEAEEQPPYAIVRLISGDQADFSSPQTVEMAIIFCAYDNSFKRAGYLDVLHAIERVRQRFALNPALKWYDLQKPPKWVMQDEDTHPYYFGGMELTFQVPTMEPVEA